MQDKEKLSFIQQEQLHQKIQLKTITKILNDHADLLLRNWKSISIQDHLIDDVFEIFVKVYHSIWLMMAVIELLWAVVFQTRALITTSSWWYFYMILSILWFALWIYSLIHSRKWKTSKKQ